MARRRILLVDDEGPLAKALARALSAAGHEVEVVDAGGARERAASFAPGHVIASADVLCALGESADAQTIALSRPVNVEEVRRALRKS